VNNRWSESAARHQLKPRRANRKVKAAKSQFKMTFQHQRIRVDEATELNMLHAAVRKTSPSSRQFNINRP